MQQNTHVVHRALSALRPGPPISAGRLTVLPFTATADVRARYVLLANAIGAGSIDRDRSERWRGGSLPARIQPGSRAQC